MAAVLAASVNGPPRLSEAASGVPVAARRQVLWQNGVVSRAAVPQRGHRRMHLRCAAVSFGDGAPLRNMRRVHKGRGAAGAAATAPKQTIPSGEGATGATASERLPFRGLLWRKDVKAIIPAHLSEWGRGRSGMRRRPHRRRQQGVRRVGAGVADQRRGPGAERQGRGMAPGLLRLHAWLLAAWPSCGAVGGGS